MSVEDPDGGLAGHSAPNRPNPWWHGLLVFIQHSFVNFCYLVVVGVAAYVCKWFVGKLEGGEHDPILFYGLKTLEYILFVVEGILVLFSVYIGTRALLKEIAAAPLGIQHSTSANSGKVAERFAWREKVSRHQGAYFIATLLGILIGLAILYVWWLRGGNLFAKISPAPGPEFSVAQPVRELDQALPHASSGHSGNADSGGVPPVSHVPTESPPTSDLTSETSAIVSPTIDSDSLTSAGPLPLPELPEAVRGKITVGGDFINVFPKSGPAIITKATFGDLPPGFESALADMHLVIKVMVDASGNATIMGGVEFPANFPSSNPLKLMIENKVKIFVRRSRWKSACNENGEAIAKPIELVVILAAHRRML